MSSSLRYINNHFYSFIENQFNAGVVGGVTAAFAIVLIILITALVVVAIAVVKYKYKKKPGNIASDSCECQHK